ncbi:hypothetical protein TR2A62_3399 [Thalassobium sp. R2A62]|nr:hypothetical protein TR2A62_3399 [Thalassobium sp. R2A62]
MLTSETPAQSLYAGPHALEALTTEALNEIFEIFPELEAAGKFGSTVRATVHKKGRGERAFGKAPKERQRLGRIGCADLNVFALLERGSESGQ